MERKIKHFDHVVRAPGSLVITPAFGHVVRNSAAARSHAPPFPSPLTLHPFFAAGDGEVSPQGVAKPGPQDQFYVTDSRRPLRETVGFTHGRAHAAGSWGVRDQPGGTCVASLTADLTD